MGTIIVKTIIISLKMLLLFTILTGFAYPLIITGIGQLAFPTQANGSLVVRDDKVIGSKLIGQLFDRDIYFSSRPSSILYDPLPSGGSNYGLTSQKLKDIVKKNTTQFAAFNRLDSLAGIPSEMIFSSASGLDPHISPQSALMQANRVAAARSFDIYQKQLLLEGILQLTETPQFFCLGQKRVNVLLLNLYSDQIE